MTGQATSESHGETPRDARTGSSPRRTRTSSLVVTLGIAGVVVIVGGGLYLALGLVPAAPPRTQNIGAVRASFATDPRVPWAGQAEVTIWVVDAAGGPITNAEVTLTYDMETDASGRRTGGMGEPSLATARMGSPGRYTAPVTFSMAGQWAVRVGIARGGRQEGQGVFLVAVR